MWQRTRGREREISPSYRPDRHTVSISERASDTALTQLSSPLSLIYWASMISLHTLSTSLTSRITEVKLGAHSRLLQWISRLPDRVARKYNEISVVSQRSSVSSLSLSLSFFSCVPSRKRRSLTINHDRLSRLCALINCLLLHRLHISQFG